LLIIFSKSLGRVGNGNPSVGVDCVFVLIVGTLLLHVKHAAFFVFSACCTTGIYDLFDLLPTPKFLVYYKIPAAYKHADGKKIDGRRVLVDVERARTVKGNYLIYILKLVLVILNDLHI
jgi:hypothetical protein